MSWFGRHETILAVIVGTAGTMLAILVPLMTNTTFLNRLPYYPRQLISSEFVLLSFALLVSLFGLFPTRRNNKNVLQFAMVAMMAAVCTLFVIGFYLVLSSA